MIVWFNSLDPGYLLRKFRDDEEGESQIRDDEEGESKFRDDEEGESKFRDDTRGSSFVKSILFRIIVPVSGISSSESTINKTQSAFSISSRARRTPSCSITSSLSRSPAVSIICKGMPSS